MDTAAITTQIEDLIKAYEAYLAKPPPPNVGDATGVAVRLQAAIERLAPRSSQYVQEVEKFSRYEPRARSFHLAES